MPTSDWTPLSVAAGAGYDEQSISGLEDSLPVAPGSLIAGKYRVERLLAAGGMGAVLRASHEVLDQPVAIKLMRPELADNQEAAQRFLREARAAAKIASDYVARVSDVDLIAGQTPFMVMEYLEGEDLDDVLSRGALPAMQAVDYALQTLAGLEAAHALGIVHRDLKPANLFCVKLADGTTRIKILDFGISKVMEEANFALKAGATTSMDAVLGTPRYMSPEQIASAKEVDARTDLWAVGLILYELLTGEYPFDGDSPHSILAKILTADATPVRTFRASLPAGLERVVDRCLQRDRSQRYESARAMMRELGPFASPRVRALLLAPDELAPDSEDEEPATLLRPAYLAPAPVVAPSAARAVAAVATETNMTVTRRAGGAPVWALALGGAVLLAALFGGFKLLLGRGSQPREGKQATAEIPLVPSEEPSATTRPRPFVLLPTPAIATKTSVAVASALPSASAAPIASAPRLRPVVAPRSQPPAAKPSQHELLDLRNSN